MTDLVTMDATALSQAIRTKRASYAEVMQSTPAGFRAQGLQVGLAYDKATNWVAKRMPALLLGEMH